jgi:hypothetical protein
MPKYVFISNLIRGRYISVDTNGEDISYDGISLNLGISDGATPQEAWDKISKTQLKTIPEIKISKIYAYEIVAEHEINNKQEPVKEVPLPQIGYVPKTCQWCGKEIPSNGAASFSHLRSHLKELREKNVITREQEIAVRSLKLTPEMTKVLSEYYLGDKK